MTAEVRLVDADELRRRFDDSDIMPGSEFDGPVVL